MFGMKSRAEKKAIKQERARLEAEKKHQDKLDKEAKKNEAIRIKNREHMKPEIDDPDALHVGYSTSAKIVITVYPDRVKLRSLHKSSLATSGLVGEKSLFITKITSVQLKMPGRMSYGYIQFKIGGESESSSSSWDALSDENAVTFLDDQTPEFIQIRDLVEQLLREQHGTKAMKSAESRSAADELKSYHDLLLAGAISDEEFQAIKKKLLGL